MRGALFLLVASGSAFVAIRFAFGYERAIAIAYGLVAAMALSISGTFFWLWRARATPLALGMGFSWSGTAGVLGWWWTYRLLDRPDAMAESLALFAFVAAYFVGAVLHFQVVGRSLGRRAMLLLLPVILTLTVAISAAI
ncbi:hypothetical protein [Ovoidimarina sediminis]|uniref:hypothetical protein n=1 Tax=Ovoidimarina sediminis TaxID=3079856 RepID=UPI0029146002|nr:hypothetical protein [Rhodophyticola sp. MJ-SS7]MDU8942252.1 hypothetical protein [Rhodophyticola sp. MJ-SS7]